MVDSFFPFPAENCLNVRLPRLLSEILRFFNSISWNFWYSGIYTSCLATDWSRPSSPVGNYRREQTAISRRPMSFYQFNHLVHIPNQRLMFLVRGYLIPVHMQKFHFRSMGVRMLEILHLETWWDQKVCPMKRLLSAVDGNPHVRPTRTCWDMGVILSPPCPSNGLSCVLRSFFF